MGNRVVILGAGESGVGAAILAQAQGFDVFVSDMAEIKPIYKQELIDLGIDFEEKQHTQEKIVNATFVIKSPGIPEKAPIIVELKNRQIPVISEIEFGARYTKAKKICITGSNGKTTTTLMIYHILQKAGFNVGLAGNIGTSLARQVATSEKDWYVIEISSFQLDGMFEFKADIAILMNITPDHLDRYEYNMQNYINSKLRIINNQVAGDFFIYCADDVNITTEVAHRKILSKQLPFSVTKEISEGAEKVGEEMILRVNNNFFNMVIKDLALEGRHNLYNSMAAGLTAQVVNIKNEVIRLSLMDFKGVEHRLEKVTTIRDITFINDSKATNVNSTWYALECMTKPVIWIAGGVDKGNDYSELNDLAKSKVKALVCMGKDNAKLKEAFEGIIPIIVDTQSIEEAVKSAYMLGTKGDVVLLSPCCASFDLFNNYEHRGKLFKEQVLAL
ncbi:MAG: UDP-N-acetylmuramoyl-L-alanine--D-glutamate ligase [Breznakibacter sp.]|nr:UDP-N-acetylmuramoyl-L-alanine--D-glutamate ligase [Breznakibacter sp.]